MTNTSNKDTKQKKYSVSANICIAEAMISLLKENSIDDIRIYTITKKAGVSRMSYYRSFSSKEEVLRFYMNYILEEFLTQIDSQSDFQSYNHILDSLNYFYQYREFAICLHKEGLSSILLDSLNNYIEKQPVFQKEKSASAYAMYYYAGALYNIYMKWILGECKETPEEIASIISSQLNPH